MIEFNARFGDPEAQVILTRLDSDLMQHIIDLEEREPIDFKWKEEAVVGVMLASKGYPGAYDKGYKVSGFDLDSHYFVSGLKKDGDHFVNAGGRVILAIGEGATVKDAQVAAYNNVDKIESDNLFYRKDIGNKAIK